MKNNFYKECAPSGVMFYKNSILESTKLVHHGFSTRIGGVSKSAYSSLNLGVNTEDSKENILANFHLFSKACNIPAQQMVLSNQVHDDKIRIVTKADCGKGVMLKSDIKGIDALITNEPGVALATFYADCTPILLLDTEKKVIASVHSGWRGTLLKIAKKTVVKMIDIFGCNPENILCVTGPSIKQCHFEVGQEVYEQFLNAFGEIAMENTMQKDDKFYIDTDALNVHSLMQCGILRGHIFVCPQCTYCHKDTLFSHRGDGGQTGRMCAVIMLR